MLLCSRLDGTVGQVFGSIIRIERLGLREAGGIVRESVSSPEGGVDWFGAQGFFRLLRLLRFLSRSAFYTENECFIGEGGEGKTGRTRQVQRHLETWDRQRRTRDIGRLKNEAECKQKRLKKADRRKETARQGQTDKQTDTYNEKKTDNNKQRQGPSKISI